MKIIVAAGVLLAFSGVASADVRESSPNLFVTERSVITTAPPATVYQALTRKVGTWWESEHTWSGKAANMSIEPKAGGCFCERLPEGGSVAHACVILAQPGKMLRLE